MKMLTGNQEQVQAQPNPLDQQILDYLAQNQNANDYQMMLDAQRRGVTAEDIARATQSDLGGIQDRFNKAEAVQQYLLRTPNPTPLGMLSQAQQSGLTPDDVQRLSGYSVEEIMRANQPESEDDSRTEMFKKILKESVENKALQGLLLTNPYTAPLAPFVPVIRPVKRLFDKWF